MARPRRQEVDYFPHYCEHGKVLFILENHFKNDGYAVFYKIEELLAKTEGHCYDCSKLESWEYLLSKMNTPEETVVGILNKLAAMGTIDKDLWNEKRIWMQSFVDSIADAYARRKVSLPVKPELMSTLTPVSGVNDGINPQSKVNKSKVKNIKRFMSDSIEVGLSDYLFNLVKLNNPNAKEPNIQTWAKDIDLMIRIDNRNPEEIKKIITWCQKDQFWHKNILSTDKLRKQYDKLYLEMGGSNGNGIRQDHLDPIERLKKEMNRDNRTDT